MASSPTLQSSSSVSSSVSSYITIAQTTSTAAAKQSLVSFKNNNLENFFSSFSSPVKKDVYSFFLGGTNSTTTDNTVAGNRVWGDVSLLRNIGRDELSPVVERINYEQNKVYDPWLSTGNAVDDRYYVYNQQNGFVYLCISSEANNRSDLFRTNNSTKQPTHTIGYQTYDDGYTWLAMYKIDDTLARFLTDSLMPVPDVVADYQEFSNSVGFANRYDTVCSTPGGTGGTGCCCTYAKQQEQKWPDNGVYSAGDFIDCFASVSNCFTCQIYGETLNRNVIFIEGGGCSGCSASYQTTSVVDKIKNSRPNKNSNLSYQIAIKDDAGVNNGQIISAFINLGGISLGNRQVNIPNPTVTVSSETGENANINLLTFKGKDGKYYVNGIKINNRGKSYSEDYVLTLPEVTNSTISTLLKNAITLHLDNVEDGVADSPRKLLNASKILFNVAIKDSDISSVINQTSFTRYGIIKNAQNSDGTVFAKNTNISEKTTKSNLVELVIRKKDGTPITSGESIPVGQTVQSSTSSASTNGANKGTVAYFKVRDLDVLNRADVSIATSNPNSFSGSNTFTAVSNNGSRQTFIVQSITTPTLRQNTGNLLFSNSTNIDIPTTARSARPTRNFRFKFVLEQ